MKRSAGHGSSTAGPTRGPRREPGCPRAETRSARRARTVPRALVWLLGRARRARQTGSARGHPGSRRARLGRHRLVGSFVAQRLEEGLLLAAGHDVDALPAADLLAQLAPDAGLLVHLDPPEVIRLVLGRGRDAVEGADVDADTAPVAVV